MDTYKTKAEEYDEMITKAIKDRDSYKNKWDDIEKIYDGDYKPLMKGGKKVRVKTHMLPNAVDTAVAVMMPPPNFQIITIPANKDQQPDRDSAKTAKSWGDYYIHKHGGYNTIEDGVTDYNLLNRMVYRVGFRKDNRKETKKEKGATKGDIPDVFYTEGSDKGKGQAFFEVVKPQNFLRAKGFKTITDAAVPGGWVAYKVCPHIDWVKAQEKFKEYCNKDGFKLDDLIGDIRYPDDEVKEEDRTESKGTSNEYNYSVLWYIYKYPTAEHPDGQFCVYNSPQKKILFEMENFREFKGMDYPFIEAIDLMPRKGNYAIPKAWRAMNAQLRTEYFEGKIIEQVRDSKTVIAVPEDAEDKILNKFKDNDDPITVLQTEGLKPQDGIYQFAITHDTKPASEGAIRSKGQFQEIMGPNFADPRMGDKIATEMVFQNKIFMQRTNKHITKINKCIEEIITALIKITEQRVSPEEQIRMSRSVEEVWVDDNEVNLEGEYVLTVKGSPLLDMTDGERSKLIQMIAQWLVSLQAIPEYKGTINVKPLIKQWFEIVGLSTAGVIIEADAEGQWAEISQMLIPMPVQVEPGDDHVEHLDVLRQYEQMLQEAQRELDDQEKQIFIQHAQQHMQILQQQSAGGQGVPGMNTTNILREAQGESVGGGALASPEGI